MSDVAVTRDGAVTTLSLSRPQRRNALTGAMYDALEGALADSDADDSVRAVVLRGTDQVFTAGNDLDDFLQRPPAGQDTPVFRFLRRVAGLAKPLVASVNGPAVGLGTTMLLHCDAVYAGESARFQLPFVRLGLVPEFASTYLLPLAAGPVRARSLLLLGEAFDAATAREAGIVTEVVADAECATRAAEAAARIAALPPEAVRATKALLREPHRVAIALQLEAEGEAFRRLLSSAAAREALTAFLAKRRPA